MKQGPVLVGFFPRPKSHSLQRRSYLDCFLLPRDPLQVYRVKMTLRLKWLINEIHGLMGVHDQLFHRHILQAGLNFY